MSETSVFLYVQHLLGIGHLKRAAILSQALAERGFAVSVASGGAPVAEIRADCERRGVRFVQLPAASAADLGFRQLLDEAGRPVDEAWRARRREALFGAWREAAPGVLVIELFPFGRRQMRFELLPLLAAAARSPRRPLIVSSVRDLLGGGQRDAARQDEMLRTFESHFDGLLVHGDPSVVGFERTFRHAGKIADRTRYTGYVVEAGSGVRREGGAGEGEVVVSAGGGAVGARLLETAIRARPLGSLAARTWRVLAGVNADAAQLAALTALAASAGEGRVIVERSRHDFPHLLANCAVSVSQAGYNTLMEIMQARARAVVVPFAGGHETEQVLRAELFARRGLVQVLHEGELSPETLAKAIDRAALRPRPDAGTVDLGGAARSAELIAQWLAERGVRA